MAVQGRHMSDDAPSRSVAFASVFTTPTVGCEVLGTAEPARRFGLKLEAEVPGVRQPLGRCDNASPPFTVSVNQLYMRAFQAKQLCTS
jgi:hypothetical protein